MEKGYMYRLREQNRHLEINGSIYGQLIFDKGSKATQWEHCSFQQMALGQLDIHMQKHECTQLLHTTHKTYFKWVTDVHIRTRTIGDLGKIIGENLCELALGKDFFRTDFKSTIHKTKN